MSSHDTQMMRGAIIGQILGVLDAVLFCRNLGLNVDDNMDRLAKLTKKLADFDEAVKP